MTKCYVGKIAGEAVWSSGPAFNDGSASRSAGRWMDHMSITQPVGAVIEIVEELSYAGETCFVQDFMSCTASGPVSAPVRNPNEVPAEVAFDDYVDVPMPEFDWETFEF